MCPKQTRVWMLQMTAVSLVEHTVQPSFTCSHRHSDALCSLLASLFTAVLGFSVLCGTPGHLDRSSYCDRPNCCPENTSSFSSFIKETLLEWCVGVKMCDYVKEIFCQTIRPKSQRYSLVKQAFFLRFIWHFINWTIIKILINEKRSVSCSPTITVWTLCDSGCN